MLVLSRKVGQELIIGDNIRITVNKISGNRVTIGISAPNDVRIVRGELEPHAPGSSGSAGEVLSVDGDALSDRLKVARQTRQRPVSPSPNSAASVDTTVPEHREPPAAKCPPLDPVKEAKGRLAPWTLDASQGADEVGRQAQ